MITFLGHGGAFDSNIGNSSAYVLLENQKSLLIDCGYTVFDMLVKGELIENIDYVFITHLHDDHCGSLSTLIYYNWFVLNKKTCLLVANDLHKKNLSNFLKHSIDEKLQNQLIEYLPIEDVPQVIAIDTTDIHVYGMQSFGLYVNALEETFVYSGDIGDPNFIIEWILNKGLHVKTVFHDISLYEGIGVHPYWGDLIKHSKKFNIVGYHFDICKAPASLLQSGLVNTKYFEYNF